MGTGRDVHLGSSPSLSGDLSPVDNFEGCDSPALWLRPLIGIGLFKSESEKLGRLRPEVHGLEHTANAATPLQVPLSNLSWHWPKRIYHITVRLL
jgi:hypothetical protein